MRLQSLQPQSILIDMPIRYQVAFRKKIYGTLDELQYDFDKWLEQYNNHRTHQVKMCCGRTPLATLYEGKQLWIEKDLNHI